MRKLPILAGLLLLAAVDVQAQQPAPANAFPEGPGRELVATACTQCHAPGPFTQLRMNEPAWRRQVENMILRGAQVRPDELAVAAGYLADHYGPGVPIPGQPRVPVSLPEGPGSNLVAGGCAICHGLDRVVAANRPGRQWQALVHRMVELGAPLTPDQSAQVVAYLQDHYAAAR